MNILLENQQVLGNHLTQPDPDIYEHQYIHCDVLIIGAGISGIMAAKTAAKNGLKTLLVDENQF
jgi:sarcosine oxidase subunit alpha